MANVISYRPGIGKQKLARLVKSGLRYKNLNQFIDHAVNKTLNEEMGSHPVVKKITAEVEKAIYKYVPLKFVNATPQEAREIEAAIKRANKNGRSIPVKDLMKKHGIR